MSCAHIKGRHKLPPSPLRSYACVSPPFRTLYPMTMSWPKLFGSQSTSKKSSRAERPRPVPVLTGKDLSYFYASSSSSSAPNTPGVWSLPSTSSSAASSRTSAPSPLRNDYFDAPFTSHSKKRSSPPEPRRPAVPRRTTYNPGDHRKSLPLLLIEWANLRG